MKSISMGMKKKQFKSIKLAAAEFNIPYMTLYMRIRMYHPTWMLKYLDAEEIR